MIRNFLQRFMLGRYGPDHLGMALIIASLIIGVADRIVGGTLYLSIPSYLVLVIAFFRIISRNITKRRAENDRFLRYWWPIRTKITRFFSNIKNRKTHKFFKCPSCKNTLRVPRGKGKIQITCPKCGERFVKKT